MKNLTRVVLLACAWFSTAAHADLNDVFNNAFGSMINVTAPGAYAGATRGVLTGGSIIVKNNVRTFHPIGFTPPSIKASCGGASIFGGAFSFINMDEFSEYLRSIVSNAAGYLFNIGLSAICPSCQNLMNSLQDAVQKVNKMFKDSCSMSKMLLSQAGINDHTPDTFKDNAFNNQVGAWANDLDAWAHENADQTRSSDNAASQNLDVAKQVYQGNLVYRALTDVNFSDAFDASMTADNKRAFIIQVMSLTGTIIAKYDDNNKLNFQYAKPVLSVKGIMDGVKGDTTEQVYNCVDKNGNANDCTDIAGPLPNEANPNTNPTTLPATISGMRSRVGCVVEGCADPASLGLPADTVGLLPKFSDPVNAAPWNTAELGLMSTTRVSVAPILRVTAPQGGLGRQFAALMSDMVAADILGDVMRQVLNEVIDSVRALKAKTNQAELKDFEAAVMAKQAELDKYLHDKDNDAARLSHLYTAFDYAQKSLHDKMPADTESVDGPKGGRS